MKTKTSNATWKNILGYEGIYEVSDQGQVYVNDRRLRCLGNTTRLQRGKILVQHKGTYPYIRLVVNGVGKNYYIHRLVAETFIPNPENKPQVNHIDGDKLNNNVKNLEWCTQSENNKHAYRTGLRIHHTKKS